jgi:hypothetical protein
MTTTPGTKLGLWLGDAHQGSNEPPGCFDRSMKSDATSVQLAAARSS